MFVENSNGLELEMTGEENGLEKEFQCSNLMATEVTLETSMGKREESAVG